MATIPITISNGIAPYNVTITNSSGTSICSTANCGGPFTTSGLKNITVDFPKDGVSHNYTITVTDSSGGTNCPQTSTISQKCDPPIGCPGLSLTLGTCSGNSVPLTANVGNSTSLVIGQYTVKLQRSVSGTWIDVSSQNVSANNTDYLFTATLNGLYKVILIQQSNGTVVTGCESGSVTVNCCTLNVTIGSVTC